MKFNNVQLSFLQKIGISIPTDSISDSLYADIEDKVSEHLQKFGFDKSYAITEDGVICESILDML